MQVKIDDFFKEQNDLFQIDETKQNLHWDEMKKHLQSTTKPKKLLWKPVAIIFSLLLLLSATYFIVNKNNNKEIAKLNNEAIINVENSETKNNQVQKNKIAQIIIEKKPALQKPAIEGKREIIIENKMDLPKLIHTNASIINKEANFYIDLTKEPEITTIDPTKENTITCKQGTIITIPANNIVSQDGNLINEPVTIITQEYYRYDNNGDNNKKANAGMVKYELYKSEEKLQVVDEKMIIIKMQSVSGKNTFKLFSNNDAIPEKKLLEMNWVSTEKFTADKRLKIDYKITLDKKFDASTFMSQIAFVKENVIMAGDIENNSLLFKNVPIGETVYFMSIGKVDNKFFNCSKKLVTGNTKITEVDFIEISEQLYKKQIEDLGKLGKGE